MEKRIMLEGLPTNLRAIMTEKRCTQAQVGEVVGVTRQAVSAYLNGTSSPDWEALVKIADYFEVSVDWLLGRSDVRSACEDVIAACKYTGLKQDTLEAISDEIKRNPLMAELLNHLFLDAGLIDCLVKLIALSKEE